MHLMISSPGPWSMKEACILYNNEILWWIKIAYNLTECAVRRWFIKVNFDQSEAHHDDNTQKNIEKKHLMIMKPSCSSAILESLYLVPSLSLVGILDPRPTACVASVSCYSHFKGILDLPLIGIMLMLKPSCNPLGVSATFCRTHAT